MLNILFAIFLLLHGLVHLLYFGQSQRIFELQPGLVWPDSSWALSRLLGNETTRQLTSVLLVVAAVAFVVSGLGLLLKQPWWSLVAVVTAVFSSALYMLTWDGNWQNLDDKGLVGLLINLGILTTILIFHWPEI